MTRDHGQKATAKSDINSVLCNLNKSGRGSTQLQLLLRSFNLRTATTEDKKVNLLANGNAM